MAKRGAAKLKEHGGHALILPPVSFTVAEFGAGFAGTLSVSAGDGRSPCSVTSASSAAQAVPRRRLANIHLEPRTSSA